MSGAPRRGQAERARRNRRMFEQWAAGSTVRAVAHTFGMHPVNVGTIINREVRAYARLHLGSLHHTNQKLRELVRDHAGGNRLAS